MPHYDLSPGMRLRAIRAGAKELKDRLSVVTLINDWRVHRLSNHLLLEPLRKRYNAVTQTREALILQGPD